MKRNLVGKIFGIALVFVMVGAVVGGLPTALPCHCEPFNCHCGQSVAISLAADEVVTFPDPNLEAAIREAINKSEGDIYQSDLDNLTSLDADGRNIIDLTGLEHCTSLTELDLYYNQISNISPVSNLTSLTGLDLGYNQISNISPVSNLTSLTWLDLWGNQISNISPVSNLTSLTWLCLGGNQISDILPVSNLTSLTELDLGYNQISDISPVSNLTSLTLLWLSSNQISDIKPLVDNSGLGGGDIVDLTSNPLSATSLNTYIPQLEARGVIVYYDVPSPKTWYVDDDLADYPDADFTKIQDAVDAASSGDTIIVYPGTYIENVDVNKDHLTIQSESGAEATVVQAANPDDHVFEITASYVNITGFTCVNASEYTPAEPWFSGICLKEVNNCDVLENIVSNNTMGIYLYYSNFNNIRNNIIERNHMFGGIHLLCSDHNSIVDNNVVQNVVYGVFFRGDSDSNFFFNNTVMYTTHRPGEVDVGTGLYCHGSNNIIRNNNISLNECDGIGLNGANNNEVVGNSLTSNGHYGIVISSGIGQLVYNDNRIYQNDFMGNGLQQAYVENSVNFWHSPEEITYTYNGDTFTNYLGNYWSDYEDRYPSAGEIDSTGIWDTPYSIDSDADNYPLVEPFENGTIRTINRYNLTISSTDGGNVTMPGEGTFTYNASEVVSLVATADASYTFVNWTGDVDTIGNVNSPTTNITMNGSYSIVANFKEIGHIDVMRNLPSVTYPGGTFDVFVNFTAPADDFNAIGLTDLAPTGWEVAVDTAWCTPNAHAVKATGNRAEIAWFGPYGNGTNFTALYKVTVPDDAEPGINEFPLGDCSKASLYYYIGEQGPYTPCVIGEYEMTVTVTIDVMRNLPADALDLDAEYPGDTFYVYVNFTAPVDDFASIGLTDLAPAGWDVETNTAWCSPVASWTMSPGNKVEYAWSGPFAKDQEFSAKYKVTIPATANNGINDWPNCSISEAWVEYWFGSKGPYESCITGEYEKLVTVPGEVWGETRDVNADLLTTTLVVLHEQPPESLDEPEDSDSSTAPDALYKDDVDDTGQYWLEASKYCYFTLVTKNVTQVGHHPPYPQFIDFGNTAKLYAGYNLDFEGDYGLVPKACTMSYAMESVNHWLFIPTDALAVPHPEWQLSNWKAMESVHSWQFPCGCNA
jgi:parallel beta-helix repeat protein